MSNTNPWPSLKAAYKQRKYGKKVTADFYQTYFRNLVLAANLDKKNYRQIKDIYDVLFKSFGDSLIFWPDIDHRKSHATLLQATYNHARKTVTSGIITKPLYKVVSGSGYIAVNIEDIAFKPFRKEKDGTFPFTLNDAKAMALLAANNHEMVYGGIKLTGTPEQQRLLYQAIEEVNETLHPEQRLRFAGDPALNKDNAYAPAPTQSSAQSHENTHCQTMSLKNASPLDFGTPQHPAAGKQGSFKMDGQDYVAEIVQAAEKEAPQPQAIAQDANTPPVQDKKEDEKAGVKHRGKPTATACPANGCLECQTATCTESFQKSAVGKNSNDYKETYKADAAPADGFVETGKEERQPAQGGHNVTKPVTHPSTISCWQEYKIAAMDIAAQNKNFDEKEGLNFFLSKARAPAYLRKDI